LNSGKVRVKRRESGRRKKKDKIQRGAMAPDAAAMPHPAEFFSIQTTTSFPAAASGPPWEVQAVEQGAEEDC
jgi:hypothetical protein